MEEQAVKVCFVCGFLEPGKSGVGDYAMLLAKKMVELGHECSLLSLHDTYVDTSLEWEISSHRIPILRLPQACSWAEKIKRAKEFIRGQKPDVLSLQYVSYAYAKRGLTWGLGGRLREMSTGIPWHIMVHEIWLGEKSGAGVKDVLVGAVQRLLAKDLFWQISPVLIHTSNLTYQGCLERRGIASKLLPMFCTIPVLKKIDQGLFLSKLRERGMNLSRRERCDYLVLGMFGILFPNWPPEPLFSRLYALVEKLGKKAIILSVGSMGSGVNLWKNLREAYRQKFDFIELGRVEENEISNILLNMDYGIAATPFQLLGKSTSAAAFLEHGIPLIVNRDEPYCLPSDSHSIDDWIIRLDQDFERRFLMGQKRVPEARIDEVGRQFARDLQAIGI